LTSERVYICLLGRSSWALLNTYYAVVRERSYHPDSVIAVIEAPFRHDAQKIRDGIRHISDGFGFSPRIECITVGEADIIDSFRKVYRTIRAKKDEGATVAVDITPGRKAVVAGTLLPISLSDVDFVFYLAISTTEDAAKPYMMIPRQYQRLHDFKEEAVRAQHVI